MKFKLVISKIRGIGLILSTKGAYRTFWLEWADGAEVLPNNKLKVRWQFPRVRFASTIKVVHLRSPKVTNLKIK